MIVIDHLFYTVKKKQVDKSKIILRKISIDKIYEILTKNCWEYGIQLEIIMKSSELIEVRLQGRRESTLFKFHKTNMIFLEDYYRFKNLMEDVEVTEGVYITTGVFEQGIFNITNYHFGSRKIILQDNFQFIKKQIWMNPRHKNCLVLNCIDFSRYLPD